MKIILVDERLTTVEADELLEARGIYGKDRKKYVDEIMEADGDKQKALIKGYRHWFQVQSIIRESDKATNQLKKQLGKGKDDATIMNQIRDIKSQTQKQVDAIVR